MIDSATWLEQSGFPELAKLTSSTLEEIQITSEELRSCTQTAQNNSLLSNEIAKLKDIISEQNEEFNSYQNQIKKLRSDNEILIQETSKIRQTNTNLERINTEYISILRQKDDQISNLSGDTHDIDKDVTLSENNVYDFFVDRTLLTVKVGEYNSLIRFSISGKHVANLFIGESYNFGTSIYNCKITLMKMSSAIDADMKLRCKKKINS